MQATQLNIFGPTQSFPFTKLESFMVGLSLDTRRDQIQDDTTYDVFQSFLTSGVPASNPSIHN